MSDMLTQLQDAVDGLAHQFVASLHFVNLRHDLEVLGPNDRVKDAKQDPEHNEVDSLPPDEFHAGLIELARDLIIKEQQIEVLISMLPGLDSSENDQERCIRELEEEVRIAEAQRLDAVKEKDEVIAALGGTIRFTQRP